MANTKVAFQGYSYSHVDRTYEANFACRIEQPIYCYIDRTSKTPIGITYAITQYEESIKAGQSQKKIVENALSHFWLTKYNNGEDVTKKPNDSEDDKENSTDPEVFFSIRIFFSSQLIA